MKLHLKSIIAVIVAVFGLSTLNAQQSQKKRIDGVVGVVGDYTVLDSDIDNAFIQLKATGNANPNISRCEILGSLLENKLFSHQAIQDSLVVTPDEINARLDEQIDIMVEQVGSIDNVVKYYNKKSYEDFRATYYDIMYENQLAAAMQRKLVSAVSITPEEIRQFYLSIPKDSLPMVGEAVELSEIIIEPEITKEERQAVIDRLNEIRQEVLDGSLFSTKAIMYSEDRGTVKNGGFFTMDKKSQVVKEFKDVAFSLKEGEISKPFQTDYGYHIIYLEKIAGKTLEVRHILLTPKPSQQAIDKAKNELDELRIRILNKEISFADAARQYSHRKENKQSGGIVRNQRGDTRFELNRMEDRSLYSLVSNLKVGEVSPTSLVTDHLDKKSFRIVQVTNKIPEHVADFSNDYMLIKDVALLNKQQEAISKWVSNTLEDTYIYINDDYKNCNFKSNWLKN